MNRATSDTTPLPTERLRDGGMNGRGCDYAVTCFDCRNFRRCEALRCTTDKSRDCQFSPSRFRAREEFRT